MVTLSRVGELATHGTSTAVVLAEPHAAPPPLVGGGVGVTAETPDTEEDEEDSHRIALYAPPHGAVLSFGYNGTGQLGRPADQHAGGAYLPTSLTGFTELPAVPHLFLTFTT